MLTMLKAKSILFCQSRDSSFRTAIDNQDSNEAWRQTALVLEESWKNTAQNPDGTKFYISLGTGVDMIGSLLRKETVPCPVLDPVVLRTSLLWFRSWL